MTASPLDILNLRTGNSCRGIMAETLIGRHGACHAETTVDYAALYGAREKSNQAPAAPPVEAMDAETLRGRLADIGGKP